MSDTPAKQKITAWADTDKTLEFTFDPVPSGGISGWTLIWKLTAYGGGVALLTKTATVTSGALGTFEVHIDAADWDDFDGGFYSWECYRSDSGYEDVVAWGSLTLRDRL